MAENKIVLDKKKVVSEFTVEVVVDMRSIKRHYFGLFGWRKWLATLLISAGAGLIRGKAKIRS